MGNNKFRYIPPTPLPNETLNYTFNPDFFFGDVMWTIEPIVILASPLVIDILRPTIPAPSKKTKVE